MTHVFTEFGDRRFLHFLFFNREILPLPRGVLDMFKKGKYNKIKILLIQNGYNLSEWVV